MSKYDYLISKAERDANGDEWRGSHLRFLNPRSRTEVRVGSAPERYARALGGSAGGSLIGGALGAAAPGNAKAKKMTGSIGAGLGAAVGETIGRRRSMARGDLRATKRRSGGEKKARTITAVPHLGAYYSY